VITFITLSNSPEGTMQICYKLFENKVVIKIFGTKVRLVGNSRGKLIYTFDETNEAFM
jgi:hypothetical protein